MRPKEIIDFGKKAPFTMLHHEPARQNSKRFDTLLKSLNSQEIDGLSDINKLVTIKSEVLYSLFTYLLVDVGK